MCSSDLSGYRPELDSSPELSAELANYYQSLIGALRLAVELRRIDIIVELVCYRDTAFHPGLDILNKYYILLLI